MIKSYHNLNYDIIKMFNYSLFPHSNHVCENTPTREHILIKLVCNWTTGTNLCKIWNKFKLNNYSKLCLVGDDTSFENVNFIIVVNDNTDYIPTLSNLAKTIFIKMEPIYVNSFWGEIDERLLKAKIFHANLKPLPPLHEVSLVIDNPSETSGLNSQFTRAKQILPTGSLSKKSEVAPRVSMKEFNMIEWHLNKTAEELLNIKFEKHKSSFNKTKGNTISSILSSKLFLPGHKLRLDFALYAQTYFNWDAYGNGFSYKFPWKNFLGNIKYKDDALIPYKYTFAGENMLIPGYFTEKLVDAILAECLCFYFGPPNIHDLINPQTYILLHPTNWDICIHQITNAINSNQWERRIDMIKETKLKIITELSLFPRINQIINTY